jgi:hypothetical protein
MHQSVMGGSGANPIALGYGDAIAYTNGAGRIAAPACNQIETLALVTFSGLSDNYT